MSPLHRSWPLVVFGCGCLAMLAAKLEAQEKQKWTDVTEKSTIEAEFVRLTDDAVVLKKDGKEISVPLDRLSLASHLQAKKLANPDAYSKPAPKAILGLEATPESQKLLESPFPPEASIEQYFDVINREVKAGNLMVFWHMLTPEMQTDVEQLVISIAQSGDQNLSVQTRTLFRDLAKIAQDQKMALMRMPQINPNPRVGAELETAWPQLVEALKALGSKNCWDSSNFKEGNIGPWLASVQSRLGRSVPALMAIGTGVMPRGPAGQPPLDWRNMFAYRIVSKEDDKAVVEFLNPLWARGPAPPPGQQRGPAGRKVEMVKVSGRWLPKEFVEIWKNNVESSKGSIAETAQSMSTGLTLVIPYVSALANAPNPQSFGQTLQQLVQLIPRPGAGPQGYPGGYPSDQTGYPGGDSGGSSGGDSSGGSSGSSSGS